MCEWGPNGCQAVYPFDCVGSYTCVNDNGNCRCLYDYYKDGCGVDPQWDSDCINYGCSQECVKNYDFWGTPYCRCHHPDWGRYPTTSYTSNT